MLQVSLVLASSTPRKSQHLPNVNTSPLTNMPRIPCACFLALPRPLALPPPRPSPRLSSAARSAPILMLCRARPRQEKSPCSSGPCSVCQVCVGPCVPAPLSRCQTFHACLPAPTLGPFFSCALLCAPPHMCAAAADLSQDGSLPRLTL